MTTRSNASIAVLITTVVLLASLLIVTAASAGGGGELLGRVELVGQTPAPTGRVVIKFTEESRLAVVAGQLSPASPAASRISSLLSTVAPDFQLERHFSRSVEELDQERDLAQLRSGRELPNLNRYVHLDPQGMVTREQLARILKALRADPDVVTAFLEPVAVPAALGFDAFTATYNRDVAENGIRRMIAAGMSPERAAPADGRTPDFTDLQGYLDPAPTGVDAEGVWGIAGGTGQTVKVLDIEGAWLWEHEDLPDPFFTAGGEIEDVGWRNHGTAVLAEIRGIANEYGVTGIAYDVQVGGVSIAELSVADAISTCSANLAPGDIFLIELHSPGPNANGSGQYGYVCMEYWQDNFDAILIATANGRICCEAAGNGEQDLDDPVYMGLFDRDVRDSGAIICGASNGESLEPAWFTNYGERVDLHGWGYQVVTCGYGDLQGGDETEWYTAGFGGTSSASPIVLGAVADLQGMAKAAFGIPLSAKLARDILVATGTPQSGSLHIGPRPDLTAAWAVAQNGIGAVSGIVSDLESGDPLEGVTITDAGSGAFVRSDAGGNYQIPLLAGVHTLSFESFFHADVEEEIIVDAGDVELLDVALQLRLTVTIGGTILSDDGATELSGVRVTPLDAPLPATVSDENSAWSIDGFPTGRSYSFAFDHLPGYGADFGSAYAPATAHSDIALHVQIPPANEDFEADDGDFTRSGDLVWEYGQPTAGGPFTGFSGTKCWGVGMYANYDDQVQGFLVSPSYDFSDTEELYLSFHYWCETESGFDGANVQVWEAASGGWVMLTPLTGYNSIVLGGIDYQSGWSGSTGGWVGAVFDLADHLSDNLQFRIQFGSDWGVDGLGFWIDDVTFDRGDVSATVPAEDLRAVIGIRGSAPNPARAEVRISLALPQAEEAIVAVYDPSGRRVRSLHQGILPAGATLLTWDGRDDRGVALANGVYFVRLRTRGDAFSRQVVLSH